MKLTLKPEHQKLIEAKLDTGRYANPDEIIAEALQLLSKRQSISTMGRRSWPKKLILPPNN
jgi:antitoxin ParD1/3/4